MHPISLETDCVARAINRKDLGVNTRTPPSLGPRLGGGVRWHQHPVRMFYSYRNKFRCDLWTLEMVVDSEPASSKPRYGYGVVPVAYIARWVFGWSRPVN